MGKLRRALVLSVFVLSGCGAAQTSPRGPSKDTGPKPEEEPKLTAPITIHDVGFMTPESVLHDEEADLYLVSNVQGAALDAEDEAFISRVTPGGALDALKWIDSHQPDVTLHAPKGMAIVSGVLYVADIDRVRKFDRLRGKPLGEIVIEGATFLKGLSADAQGNLLVTDGGLGAGYKDSGSDAVYRIDTQGRVTPLAKAPELGHPNGVLANASGVWVATFGSGELYRLGAQGEKVDVQKLPKGSLDGLVAVPGGALVSSWEASAVYQVDLKGAATEAISGLNAPAGIGFDQKRKRALIPLFNDDAVVIHQL